MEPSGDRTIEVDGTHVRVGTAVYDTEYDRVLWVSAIDATGIAVEPATEYEVERPTGWPADDVESNVITGDTVFSVRDFERLIRQGRFEISPR